MKAIETDGGTAFRNKLMTELCKLLQIKHILAHQSIQLVTRNLKEPVGV